MRLSSNFAYQLPIAFQLETAQLQNRLHRPGIEPGPPAWQASILPLNQRCQLTYLPRAIPQLLQKYEDHVSTLTAHMLNFQQVGELPPICRRHCTSFQPRFPTGPQMYRQILLSSQKGQPDFTSKNRCSYIGSPASSVGRA